MAYRNIITKNLEHSNTGIHSLLLSIWSVLIKKALQQSSITLKVTWYMCVLI